MNDSDEESVPAADCADGEGREVGKPRGFGLDLTEGEVGPLLRRMAIPTGLGMLAIISFSLVDTYFVSRLGLDPLAAVSFTFPVVMVANAVGSGLGAGIMTMVGSQIGAGDRASARRSARDAVLIVVLVSVLGTSLGIPLIGPLFRSLGAGPELIPYIKAYMVPWWLGLVFMLLPMSASALLRASGDMRLPAVMLSGAALINVVLDPLLMFGLGPIPAFGLAGAAYASLVARVLVTLFAFHMVVRKRGMVELGMPSASEFMSHWRELWHVALPALGTQLLVPGAQLITTVLVAPFGSAAVAGFGVATRVEMVSSLPVLALSISMMPFVAQNLGGKKLARIQRAARIAAGVSLIWGVLVYLLLFGLGVPIADAFSDDSQVHVVVVSYFMLVIIALGAGGVQNICSSVLNALRCPWPALLLNIGRHLLVAAPLGWALSWSMGYEGVFVALSLSALVFGLASWFVCVAKQRSVGEGLAAGGAGALAGPLR